MSFFPFTVKLKKSIVWPTEGLMSPCARIWMLWGPHVNTSSALIFNILSVVAHDHLGMLFRNNPYEGGQLHVAFNTYHSKFEMMEWSPARLEKSTLIDVGDVLPGRDR